MNFGVGQKVCLRKKLISTCYDGSASILLLSKSVSPVVVLLLVVSVVFCARVGGSSVRYYGTMDANS